MDPISLMIVILIGMLIVVIIVGLIARALRKKVTVHAKVIKKHETRFDSISHHNPNGSEHLYVITFRTDKGEEIALKTSSWVYGTLYEDEEFTIIYKGSMLVKAIPDEEEMATDEDIHEMLHK